MSCATRPARNNKCGYALAHTLEVECIQLLEVSQRQHCGRGGQQIFPDGKALQLSQRVQALHLCDTIGEESQVRQLRQRLQRVKKQR